MGMYIRTPEGEWMAVGGLTGDGATFTPEDETTTLFKTKRFVALDETNPKDMMDDGWIKSLTGPRTISFEMKFPKFNQEDFIMLVCMVSRKEARRILGTKPILKKGKAWR